MTVISPQQTPSGQRREEASQVREEQLQCSPSSYQGQEGPSSCGGNLGGTEKGHWCFSPP